MATLGLHRCTWALVAASGGYSLVAVHGLLILAAFLVRSRALGFSGVAWRGLRSCGLWALELGLSSCGAWTRLPRGVWDLPGPGLESTSPALAGGLLTPREVSGFLYFWLTSYKSRFPKPLPWLHNLLEWLIGLRETLLLVYYGLSKLLSGKESTSNAEDVDLIPGIGRSPGEGHGNLLQDSCLGNPMDRGAWRAAVHGVAKRQTQLSD